MDDGALPDGSVERPGVLGYGLLAFAGGTTSLGSLWLLVTAPGLPSLAVALWLIGPVAALGAVGIVVRGDVATDLDEELLPYVGGWTLGGMVAFGLAGELTAYFMVLRGDAHAFTLWPLVGWANGGVAIGCLIGLYDAERRQRAADLAVARDEASLLAQQYAVLNRVLRHDIRNDAQIILAYLDEVRDDVSGNDAVEEALDVARRRTGRVVEHARKARDAEQVLRSEPAGTGALDVATRLGRIAAEVREEYPQATLRVIDAATTVDATGHELIDTALYNLLENAVVHNDGEAPTVEVTITGDGKWIDVAVADDGPGIPDDELRVLDEGAESVLQHSQGMGLWLVNWIVRRSGGEMIVDRADDTGSTVRLRLPAATE